MMSVTVPAVVAAFAVAALSPLVNPGAGTARYAAVAAQAADTATVRLHISGMTCGTCPATARRALTRLAGVYSATVTFPDSLGIVRFDPALVTPSAIAAHLTKMTGYGAKVLADSVKVRKP